MSKNPGQEIAIHHVHGPMLVLAGPGSGKTYTITQRIVFLTTEENIPPHDILVVTFTKAAAGEMRDRYLSMAGMKYRGVTFGTFHSIFFLMLRSAYGYTGDNILKESERYLILQNVVNRYQLEVEDMKEFLGDLSGEISLVKGNGLDLAHYYSTSCPDEIFRRIYEDYQSLLKEAGKIDFDDMLVDTRTLLLERPDIRKGWQKRFPYLLIDEFQDINQIQYEIMKLLAGEEKNLFVVGDDDQSIYGFRGARPEFMLDFEKDFPGTKKVLLAENYRSTGAILKGAGNLIAHNSRRFPKELFTSKPEGKPIKYQEYATCREENEAIAAELRLAHTQGMPYEEMAVLVRTNAAPRALLQVLKEYNIPFYAKDTIPNLFDHWIAKDVRAYLILGEDLSLWHRETVLEVMNRPNRYIRRDTLREPMSMETLYHAYHGKSWMIERLEQWERDLKYMHRVKPYDALVYLEQAVGYGEYLKEYATFRKMKEEELLDVLGELKESAKGFSTGAEWIAYQKDYEKNLREKEKAAKTEERPKAVVISTMHSAKGLEYEKVILPDVVQGMMPYAKAIKPEDLEEERRMFYVAMTRAKQELSLYWSLERYSKKQEPSPYLKEIGIPEVHTHEKG